MEDGVIEPPAKRQREAWDGSPPDAAASTARDAEQTGDGAADRPAAAHSTDPQQFTSDSGSMEGDGNDSSDEAGRDGQAPDSAQQEQGTRQAQDGKPADEPAAAEPASGAHGASTSRLSAPAGLGLGSGIGLPPRGAAPLGPRRTSGGLPAVGIGSFSGGGGVAGCSVPRGPGAWAPHQDARPRAGHQPNGTGAADESDGAQRSPMTGGSGSGKRPTVATPFATPGAGPSNPYDPPGLAEQLARIRAEGVDRRAAAAAAAAGAAKEHHGDNSNGGGDSTRMASSTGWGHGSMRIASGASHSGSLPGDGSGGGGARRGHHLGPTSQDLQAQLGGEAAAAGISGDQLQAALELAARVPLRAVAFADGDADEPALAKAGGGAAAREALDTLLAALARVAAPRGQPADHAAANRAPLLRRLQAAALAAASDALAQWEAVQAHARAARRGWAAASSLDAIAAQRRRLLKHMLRLPAEEAGEELLEALEAVRASVAAALRAAAGRDAAAAAARAAAGRLLSAGVGGVTGPQLAPGGATEAAADRDLNRLYTLLRLLQGLEVNTDAASGGGGLLAQAQLPPTRSARIASRHLARVLQELPQSLQAAIRTSSDDTTDAQPDGAVPKILSGYDGRSPSPSPSPPPQQQQPPPPAASMAGHQLQPAAMPTDHDSSPYRQAASTAARQQPASGWLSFNGDAGGGGGGGSAAADACQALLAASLTAAQLQQAQQQAGLPPAAASQGWDGPQAFGGGR